jgi:hypothetical protein
MVTGRVRSDEMVADMIGVHRELVARVTDRVRL